MQHVDVKAWLRNPEHNQVYNKLWLAQSQNIECAPTPVRPDSYPVFYKPIYNLYGLSVDAFKAEYPVQEKHLRPGLFWMEYLGGKHWSIGGTINHGKLNTEISVEGIKGKEDGLFEYWRPMKDNIGTGVKSWLHRNLNSYVGPINLEGIGGKIIEVHLRRSGQLKNMRDGKDYCVPAFIKSETRNLKFNQDNLKELKAKNKSTKIFKTIFDGKAEKSKGNYVLIGYTVGKDLYKCKKVSSQLKKIVYET